MAIHNACHTIPSFALIIDTKWFPRPRAISNKTITVRSRRSAVIDFFFFDMFTLKIDTGKSRELRRKIIAIIVQIVVRIAHF